MSPKEAFFDVTYDVLDYTRTEIIKLGTFNSSEDMDFLLIKGLLKRMKWKKAKIDEGVCLIPVPQYKGDYEILAGKIKLNSTLCIYLTGGTPLSDFELLREQITMSIGSVGCLQDVTGKDVIGGKTIEDAIKTANKLGN